MSGPNQRENEGCVIKRSVYLGCGWALLLGEGSSKQHLQHGKRRLAAAAAAAVRLSAEGRKKK